MDTGLQKYRAFVAAADKGSIAHAADYLGYSVSSVSRMISDLETTYHLRLFDRGKAGVVLTPDGQRLLAHARGIINECERFESAAASLCGAETGTVRIGTVSSVAAYALPSALKALRDEHPGVSCELLLGDYEETVKWLSEGRVDLATVRLPATAELETLPLVNDEYVAVLPEGHPRAQDETFPLAAFSNEPFLALERGGMLEVAELLAQNNVELAPTFTVWDDYVIMAMVEAGLGLGILPSIMMNRCTWHVVALPLDIPAQRSIALAWSRRRAPSAATAAFLDVLSKSPVH